MVTSDLTLSSKPLRQQLSISAKRTTMQKWKFSSAILILILVTSSFPLLVAFGQSSDSGAVDIQAGFRFAKLTFVNNVQEYVDENPHLPKSFVGVPPDEGPLVVYRRGGEPSKEYKITVPYLDCKLKIWDFDGEPPDLVNAKSGDKVWLTKLDDRTYRIDIPPPGIAVHNLAVGLYEKNLHIWFDFPPYEYDTGEDDYGEVIYIWVIFNAVPGSPDPHVNGLNANEFEGYVMEKWGYTYYWVTSTANVPGGKEDASTPKGWRDGTNNQGEWRWYGKARVWTLRPQNELVFRKAMEFVDGNKSANIATDLLTISVSTDILRGRWDGAPASIDNGNIIFHLGSLKNTGVRPFGQCMTFSAMLCGLVRSIGIPNRMVTNINDIAKLDAAGKPKQWWNFHAWNEAWLNEVTPNDWSGHDSTPGMIVLTERRNSIDFQERLGVWARGGDATFWETKVFTYDAKTKSRIDVTKKYEDPLSDPSFFEVSENIIVAPSKSVYSFGEDVLVNVMVINSRSYDISTFLNFTLGIDELGELHLDGPYTIYNASDYITVPANSEYTKQYTIPSNVYTYDGKFIASASIKTETIETNFVEIDILSQLKATLIAPARALLNGVFSINTTITNNMPVTIYNILVNASIADYLNPSEPINFVIPSMLPNESVTCTIHTNSSLEGVEAISVTAYSDQAGSAIAYAVTQIFYPYDAAITNVASSKTVVGQSYGLNINVTMANQGYYTEAFNITVYANQTIIAIFENIILTSGNSTTITFTWNTTGFAKGNYTIKAIADTVPGETYTGDNKFTGGVVTVTIPGDLDGNFAVQLVDLVMLAKAYGSKPGEPNWNPNADLDDNGIVGLTDLVTLAKNYGKTDP
jgi:hypothetical protein